ncbi:hypothetical protein COO72_02540 [Bifidobacterium callitrichos]|nr:hypothetical protein COO72_02540 [Bifidobacterium callitrichos]
MPNAGESVDGDVASDLESTVIVSRSDQDQKAAFPWFKPDITVVQTDWIVSRQMSRVIKGWNAHIHGFGICGSTSNRGHRIACTTGVRYDQRQRGLDRSITGIRGQKKIRIDLIEIEERIRGTRITELSEAFPISVIGLLDLNAREAKRNNRRDSHKNIEDPYDMVKFSGPGVGGGRIGHPVCLPRFKIVFLLIAVDGSLMRVAMGVLVCTVFPFPCGESLDSGQWKSFIGTSWYGNVKSRIDGFGFPTVVPSVQRVPRFRMTDIDQFSNTTTDIGRFGMAREMRCV